MSGSDAPVSSASGYGAGAGGDGVDCHSLQLVRTLQAPVPDVVKDLHIDDVCHVLLRAGPPEVVVITDELDRDAGGILPTMALLSCLRRGVEYVAVVRAIAGGAIELNVQARDCTTLRRLVKIRLEPGCSVATGDLLTVEAATGIAAEHRVAVAGGATVGQFDWDEALAACLDEGLRFRAQIVSITDAGVLAVIRGAP